jgi:CHAT domain-containing protein
MPLVRALAETQREMIDASGSHPYFWAPFILVGKYR